MGWTLLLGIQPMEPFWSLILIQSSIPSKIKTLAPSWIVNNTSERILGSARKDSDCTKTMAGLVLRRVFFCCSIITTVKMESSREITNPVKNSLFRMLLLDLLNKKNKSAANQKTAISTMLQPRTDVRNTRSAVAFFNSLSGNDVNLSSVMFCA